MRIDHRKHRVAEAVLDRARLHAVPLEPRLPPREAVCRYLERHFDGEAVPDARGRHLRPWKERQISARVPFRVGVEEMIRAGIVLIDAALDQPHAEDAGIEVEILLRRTGNRGDVVNTSDGVHGDLPEAIRRVADDSAQSASRPRSGADRRCP